jgi:hypothetical protein
VTVGGPASRPARSPRHERPGQSAERAAELRHELEAALFARGAVRQGRHLRIQCPVPGHVDRHPSCDVDLERGWYCRACHASGGLRQLAELLGMTPLTLGRPVRRWRPRVPIPPRGIAWADWVPAWLDVLQKARRQARRLEPHCDGFRIADWLRPRHQVVTAARLLGSTLGDADPRAWRLLVLAARIEAETAAVEAELDAVRRHVA